MSEVKLEHVCPICGSGFIDWVLDVGTVPVNSCLQVFSADEAMAISIGRIVLGYCQACGYLYNAAFNPAMTEYSGRYEETQGYSAVFQSFHRELAQSLIERFDLRGQRVLEIGCGKGEFLLLLAEMGVGSAIGFDPGHDPERMPEHNLPVQVVKAFYDEDSAKVQADFVCCKMTLEHIPDPIALLRTLNRSQLPGTGIFFMVPDATRIITAGAFEDVYYEHCAYYTPTSLGSLFERAGFEIWAVESLYDGQYLGLSGCIRQPTDPAQKIRKAGKAASSVPILERFSQRYTRQVGYWRTRCQAWLAEGKRIVLWGGGSKAVAFLGVMQGFADKVIVVDINPHRQGAYLPGTRCCVVAPTDIQSMPPDVVIVMNAIYREEIQASLRNMGLTNAAVECL